MGYDTEIRGKVIEDLRLSRSVAVHSGSFHADEVMACALLLFCGLIDAEKVIRTREKEKIFTAEYVCDVGGVYDSSKKLFDHHQIEYEGKLSSAGMVLKYLIQNNLIESDFGVHLEQMLVSGIDAIDNGNLKVPKGLTTFSAVIANFMPVQYTATSHEIDLGFKAAMEFSLQHLKRIQGKFVYAQKHRQKIKNAMQQYEDCIIFDEPFPWTDIFFELEGAIHPAKFIIMPTNGHWKLRGIPPSLGEKMKVRVKMPNKWAGLMEEELARVSKIDGAIFCHKGRFISIWKTKEDAIKAFQTVIRGKKGG